MTSPGQNTVSLVVESLRRPYRVSFPLIVLMSFVPFYIVIGEVVQSRTMHAPEISLDRMVPLEPAWALVYGPLYLFLILMPFFVIRNEEMIRRTVLAYLTVWSAAYVCFLAYPTMAPRPLHVVAHGFVGWGVRFLYSADPPYNCFPSLHVAHSFVSALASYRSHRGVGVIAGVCAALVGVSTLFTRQHYILDVVAGILLAYVAYAMFLRSYPRESVTELDRRLAPSLAGVTAAIVAFLSVSYWFVYRIHP